MISTNRIVLGTADVLSPASICGPQEHFFLNIDNTFHGTIISNQFNLDPRPVKINNFMVYCIGFLYVLCRHFLVWVLKISLCSRLK
jgi:hypothetical protein